MVELIAVKSKSIFIATIFDIVLGSFGSFLLYLIVTYRMSGPHGLNVGREALTRLQWWLSSSAGTDYPGVGFMGSKLCLDNQPHVLRNPFFGLAPASTWIHTLWQVVDASNLGSTFSELVSQVDHVEASRSQRLPEGHTVFSRLTSWVNLSWEARGWLSVCQEIGKRMLFGFDDSICREISLCSVNFLFPIGHLLGRTNRGLY